jgi:hypothetical protein
MSFIFLVTAALVAGFRDWERNLFTHIEQMFREDTDEEYALYVWKRVYETAKPDDLCRKLRALAAWNTSQLVASYKPEIVREMRRLADVLAKSSTSACDTLVGDNTFVKLFAMQKNSAFLENIFSRRNTESVTYGLLALGIRWEDPDFLRSAYARGLGSGLYLSDWKEVIALEASEPGDKVARLRALLQTVERYKCQGNTPGYQENLCNVINGGILMTGASRLNYDRFKEFFVETLRIILPYRR